ncbi:Disease resistance protein L6 [Linum grandiflorum]
MEQKLVHFGEGTTAPNASAEQQHVEYEVFLSFRGPDVRKSFADFLYSYFVHSKIRTFRDEEELQKGEIIAPSLVQAITESKIYIPILSKSYASSKWCLQELAKMVECCRKGKGHIIFPVFYFMDPRDVRHQAGPYEEAFEQHSKKHDAVIIQDWRITLQEVGQMKGWHVTELDGQGAVIDELFSKVELHLRANYTLVTDELVGIDFHVQEVMRLLNNIESGDGKIVGIQGIGGMGKTTIAKAVFDKICANFNRCCFLENVRELLSKSDGITSLQNKLISSILRVDFQVKDASEGVKTIRERVCKYKVLVVLDDVDDKFEFGQILGKLDNFSSESRFVITTRNKRVVEVLPEYKLYEPKEMSHDHSLQLFSRHAFGMHYPPEGYAALCDEFVKVSANLPLALKVIGSLMFRRDRQFWEEKLMQLREVPGSIDKVQHRLKISYNELTYEEKEIFLDIACFFIGEDKELPVHMWSDKELYPESVIRTLILRSLIKLDGTNRIWMHDHLRDLGRAIVIEEDVGNPYKRSRIWSKNDAICMLKNKKVCAFRLSACIFHVAMNGDFRGVLPSLFWIKLSCFYNPFNLNLKNVVILELQGWDIFDGWQGWNSVKMARKLKIINLRGSFNLLMLPDLSRCGNLESIDLTLCRRTRGKLNISAFRNLKVVMLQDTKIALTGDMGKLQKLEEIRTGDIWQLPKLKTLKMVKCSCKGSLLSDQDGLLPSSLTCLVVDWSRGLTGLPNLANLSNLMELRLFQFSASEIRGLGKLRVLETLEISESMSLDHLHGLDDLVHLKELTLKSCGLDCLPSLSNLIRLHKLVIVRCPLLSEIPGLGELKRSLLHLEVSCCESLAHIDGLESLEGLESLTLESATQPPRLGDLSRLQNLKQLCITGWRQVPAVLGLERLQSLRSLEMKACKSLRRLPNLLGLDNLETLDVSGCIQLVDVTGLDRLKSLQKLNMPNCCAIDELPDISGMKNLEVLDVSECIKLVRVTGLVKLESLEELYMVDCKSINELPDMSNLRNLMKLNLKGCKKLKNVKGLEKLHLLWFVRMGNRLHLKYPLKTVAWASREVAVSLFGRAFMKEHEELTSWYHKQIKDRR